MSWEQCKIIENMQFQLVFFCDYYSGNALKKVSKCFAEKIQIVEKHAISTCLFWRLLFGECSEKGTKIVSLKRYKLFENMQFQLDFLADYYSGNALKKILKVWKHAIPSWFYW